MGNHAKNKFHAELDHILIDPLIETFSKERPPNNLETQKHFKLRMKHHLKDAHHKFESRLKSAIKVLEREHAWPSTEHFAHLIELLSDSTKWENEISKGKTLQEIIGFTNEDLARFYDIGNELFKRKSYDNASHIFLLLTQLNPAISAFWISLGASEEGCGELQNAIYAYVFGAELDENAIGTYLQIAKCFVLLNQREQAKEILLQTIERTKDFDHLKDIKSRSEIMLKALREV